MIECMVDDPRSSVVRLATLLPLGLLRADVRAEDPMPHQFAQGLGGVFLFAAAAALFAGATPLGWTLNWLVSALAFVNLTVQFCVGCFVYLQLDRVGLLPAAMVAPTPVSAVAGNSTMSTGCRSRSLKTNGSK